jgi:DNA polymerase III sliding clamp (beta) subunit (PCNA family)
MKKVLFAGGFMESKPKFLYWVLRAGKESVRYVAGSGSRFAILDQEGNLSDVSDDTDILMPVAQSSIVLKAISSTSADNVVVNQYGDKIEFVVGHLTFIAMGLIEDIKWIDENSIYERKSLHRLVLAKKDIEFAMKGVVAAESDIDKKRSAIHVVTLSLDPSASKVVVSSDRTAKKSVRKIDVLAHNGPNDSVEFSAAATLLLDIVKECDSQNVQLEIESSSKPLVVRGHASNDVEEPEKLKNKHDSTGATEMFGMLISSRQKSS